MLTIDIGNTTIALAVVEKFQVKESVRVDTHASNNVLQAGLKNAIRLFNKKGNLLKVVTICSVVPKKTVFVANIIRKILGINPQVVGKDVLVPLVNRYRDPKQVGQDRLVGAYAAAKLYGAPVIVIDLGTAITFDVVSKKQEYLGGVIVPGIRLSAESLFLKTALLPKIDIKAPKSVIGRTTQESILSGLFYGYGSLIQGFIGLVSDQINARPKVVMTGGHTHLMKHFVTSKIRIIDDGLVHKGMALLASEC